MGPKKQSKGKGDEEEDTSTADLLIYYKRFCKQQQIPICKSIENQINAKLEEDMDLPELLIDEKLNEDGAIELCRALKTVNKGEGYKHLQSIRIWEGNIGNQGVRAFYNYIDEYKVYKISLLEFINCEIGELGCEFISRLLNFNTQFQIKFLTLDYNLIGNKGLFYLAESLRYNTVLTYLSLNYCGIDDKAKDELKQIFEGESSIEKFYIQGNHIGNTALGEFLTFISGLEESPLEEINLANTQIGNDKFLIESLILCMTNNKVIHTYNLKYNLFTPDEFKLLIKCLVDQKAKDDKHLYQIPIDEVYDQLDFKQFFDVLKTRKKPKPKKKKPVKKPPPKK